MQLLPPYNSISPALYEVVAQKLRNFYTVKLCLLKVIRVADEEYVYPSGFEKKAETVTEVVEEKHTCGKSLRSMAFTLRLRKL